MNEEEWSREMQIAEDRNAVDRPAANFADAAVCVVIFVGLCYLGAGTLLGWFG